MASKQGDPGLADAKVRIITKSEIRYEGTLYQINSGEKTVALKDVVSYGSEDRCKDKFVPPGEVVYEFIVFKGCEIKDLVVLKDDKKTNKTVKKDKKEDPQTKQKNNNDDNKGQKDRKEEKKEKVEKKKIEKTGDFEFDGMLEKLGDIERSKQESDLDVKQYKGDDFFDDLSTSIGKRTGPRDDHYLKKNVAKETFGHVSNKTFNDINNYRRRGRGNRGNRGHYNNQRNYNNNGYYNRNQEYGRGNWKKSGGRRYQKEEEFEYVRKDK